MKVLFALAAAALLPITTASLAQPPTTPEELVAAAKRAAGRDYAGTFLRICVAPDNLGGGAPRPQNAAPRAVPERGTWYAQPYKVFDDLYFVGTKIHSAWALTTREGIIVIDTLFDYAIEPEIVEGIRKLGLDPREIKYVLISHAPGDHDQGAALLQRYGAKVVMGAADWDATLQRPASAAGGVPQRDIAVGPEGMKIVLGGTTVDVIATPGHTPGTLSYIFPVRDGSRTLRVAYSGGTAFNFPRRADNFAVYRDSARKMGAAAAAAGATVLMTNHTEFDGAYDRARIAQLPRASGEKHPYESDAATVQRYFEMTRNCAEAQRLATE
jgi:metallo-beta-lactamase class B